MLKQPTHRPIGSLASLPRGWCQGPQTLAAAAPPLRCAAIEASRRSSCGCEDGGGVASLLHSRADLGWRDHSAPSAGLAGQAASRRRRVVQP
jgi:hypothetical protein